MYLSRTRGSFYATFSRVSAVGSAMSRNRERMNFLEAIQVCLSKYATFHGRARRSEYWWFALFNLIVSVIAAIIDQALGGGQIFQVVVSLALFLPSLAVAIRRLHDTNRSGWWILIGLIPLVGFIILIVWFCTDSAPGDNNYGPYPKAPSYV